MLTTTRPPVGKPSMNRYIDRMKVAEPSETIHHYFYARVSRKREADLGYGNLQTGDMNSVVLHPPHVIVATRYDLGVSVYANHVQHQRGLAELIGLMDEDPHPNIVLNVTNESRIARSEEAAREWFTNIMMTGAVIEVIGGRRYESTEEDYRAFVKKCADSEAENYNRGAGTYVGIAKRMLRGLPTGNYPWALERDLRGAHSFSPHLAPLAETFFRLMRSGAQLDELVDRALGNAWWPQRYNSQDVHVHRKAILRTLRNPVYAGLLRVGPDRELVTTASELPPLISLEEFVLVQHQHPVQFRRPPRQPASYLDGWLTCADCGKGLRRSPVRFVSPSDEVFVESDMYGCGVNGCRPRHLTETRTLLRQVDALVPTAAHVRGETELAVRWENGSWSERPVLLRKLFPNRIRVGREGIVPTTRIQRLLSSSPHSTPTIVQDESSPPDLGEETDPEA